MAPSETLLTMPAWRLPGLSTKSRGLLKGYLNGVAVIDVIQLDDKYDLMIHRGYGARTARDIKYRLAGYGLRLGMSIPEIVSWSAIYDSRASSRAKLPIADFNLTQDELRQIYYGEPPCQ